MSDHERDSLHADIIILPLAHNILLPVGCLAGPARGCFTWVRSRGCCVIVCAEEGDSFFQNRFKPTRHLDGKMLQPSFYFQITLSVGQNLLQSVGQNLLQRGLSEDTGDTKLFCTLALIFSHLFWGWVGGGWGGGNLTTTLMYTAYSLTS